MTVPPWTRIPRSASPCRLRLLPRRRGRSPRSPGSRRRPARCGGCWPRSQRGCSTRAPGSRSATRASATTRASAPAARRASSRTWRARIARWPGCRGSSGRWSRTSCRGARSGCSRGSRHRGTRRPGSRGRGRCRSGGSRSRWRRTIRAARPAAGTTRAARCRSRASPSTARRPCARAGSRRGRWPSASRASACALRRRSSGWPRRCGRSWPHRPRRPPRRSRRPASRTTSCGPTRRPPSPPPPRARRKRWPEARALLRPRCPPRWPRSPPVSARPIPSSWTAACAGPCSSSRPSTQRSRRSCAS